MYPKRALSTRFMLEFLHSAPARWVAPIRNIGAARANHDHSWVARKSKLQANDFEAISAIRTMVVFNSGQFHRIVLALRNRGIAQTMILRNDLAVASIAARCAKQMLVADRTTLMRVGCWFSQT